MERLVPALQRRVFPGLANPVHGWRTFTEAEVDGERKLAVVNETFVKKYMAEENPIGQRVYISQLGTFPDPVKDPWFEIIGVVGGCEE